MDWEIKPSSGLLVTGDKKQADRTLVPTKQTADSNVAAIVEAVLSKLQRCPMVENRKNMISVKAASKQIRIGGEDFLVDAATLMRMIKQVTQTIGEYKSMDNIYSRYVVPSLRKARSDMVSDLERHFNVKWEIDAQGNSNFFT